MTRTMSTGSTNRRDSDSVYPQVRGTPREEWRGTLHLVARGFRSCESTWSVHLKHPAEVFSIRA